MVTVCVIQAGRNMNNNLSCYSFSFCYCNLSFITCKNINSFSFNNTSGCIQNLNFPFARITFQSFRSISFHNCGSQICNTNLKPVNTRRNKAYSSIIKHIFISCFKIWIIFRNFFGINKSRMNIRQNNFNLISTDRRNILVLSL